MSAVPGEWWGSSQMFSFISTGVLKFPSTILWQIWFLCHVNLYTVTNTVVPGVWNETQLLICIGLGTVWWHLLQDRLCLLLKDWWNILVLNNTCWLSSQKVYSADSCYISLREIVPYSLFMPTYTYSTFQHLLQYSVGQPYVTTVHPGGNILAKLLSM